MATPCILVIEDDPDGRRSVSEAIQEMDCRVIDAANGKDGLQAFRDNAIDVVLSDLVLPDIDGVEVLSGIRHIDDQVPVMIMTAYGTVSSAVRALRSGAYDYITKPLDLDDLQSKIRRSLETRRLRGEISRLKKSVKDRYAARTMVAGSQPMCRILKQIEALADTNATVIILGESGTGKELVARALHVDSRRASAPFVAVNCGAFPETLLDSELFGHEKGSFTGATQQRKGAFERADGGTLLLDEVGDAPPAVQVKLLRVLEEREFFRIGGQQSIRVDVRVVSASNRDLDELVRTGDFREDLLYRLKVVTIRIPPLRERPEDIRALADRFIAAACEEHGREIASVEAAYYASLEAHPWPGNVRQLRNIVESSVVMATSGVLRAEDTGLADTEPGGTDLQFPESMTMADIEREVLTRSLRRYQGNRTLTAEKLGLSRRTIQRKIQEYELPF